MRRRIAALALVALMLTASGGCGGDDPAPADRTLAGDLVGGGSYDPATHRGRVTVVNFWGSWCGPCRAETPELIAAYEAVRADDVVFLGISVRDPDRDKAQAFVAAQQMPYPNIYDPPGKLALAFDVPPSTIPTTLILRRDGSVAKEYRRSLLRDELIAAALEVAGDG